ncbi:hypothetical protein [uncultured archaeal virus]|uniref:Uncharacterized protein n=1 Tax=uncultured archaeal virus TaxID=1960247 RepID=A0A8B0LTT5_9VIRU|nr:hypothetical protein [uncultured archaeal virus]
MIIITLLENIMIQKYSKKYYDLKYYDLNYFKQYKKC